MGHLPDVRFRPGGPFVPRLIDTKPPTARQRHLGEQTPAFVLHRATGNAVLTHVRDKGFYVVAQQIEFLLHVVLAGGMHGSLRWWQSENQIATASINRWQPEYVAQEPVVGVGVRAVDDRMCTDDHGCCSSPFAPQRSGLAGCRLRYVRCDWLSRHDCGMDSQLLRYSTVPETMTRPSPMKYCVLTPLQPT